MMDILKDKLNPEWIKYQLLIHERPDLFSNGSDLEIQIDPILVNNWEENHKRKIGVLYESDYSMMVVDLVKDRNGNLFSYERIIPVSQGEAVVCIPIYNQKFVFLEQFRHSLRRKQWAFPRGFGETGVSGPDNAKKELAEELGCQTLDLQYIGSIVGDSGLSGNKVPVYLCSISEPQIKIGYEGIESIQILSFEEIKQWIREGFIDDAFTLSALELLSCRNDTCL